MKTYDIRLPFAIFDNGISEPVARDCDCACQEVCFPDNTRTKQHVSLDLKYSCNDFIVKSVNDTYFTVMTPNTNTFGVLNQCAINFLNAFKEPQSYTEVVNQWPESFNKGNLYKLFDQLVQYYLLLPEPYVKPEIVQTFSTLTAWIQVTNQCNLNCSYCYLKQDETKMSLGTGRRTVRNIFSTAKKNASKKIKIKYAGGEPLLNFQLIRDMHRLAEYYSNKTKIPVQEVLLSNGLLLTTEMLEYLKKQSIDLMISLDGVQAFNDIHRYDFNNTGSYEKVINNIENAILNGLSPQISITLSNANAKGLPELIKWILERKLRFNFNFCRATKKNQETYSIDEKIFTDSILQAFDVIEHNFPLKSSLLSIIDRSNLSFPHYYTCGVGHNYLVFDCVGNLASCHMEIGKHIQKSLVSDNFISLMRETEDNYNLSVEINEDCRSCKWKYWCTSGCPLNTYNVKHKYAVKSPYCNIYKKVFPKLIKLEALRLISNNA